LALLLLSSLLARSSMREEALAEIVGNGSPNEDADAADGVRRSGIVRTLFCKGCEQHGRVARLYYFETVMMPRFALRVKAG